MCSVPSCPAEPRLRPNRCDAPVRGARCAVRCGAVRGARYHTVAAENPSILGLLAYVQCAELPCRAASASWAAK